MGSMSKAKATGRTRWRSLSFSSGVMFEYRLLVLYIYDGASLVVVESFCICKCHASRKEKVGRGIGEFVICGLWGVCWFWRW